MAVANNLKDRLIEYLEYKKEGQTAFEKRCGLSNSYVNNLKTDKPSNAIQAKIFGNNPDLSPNWLLFGEGDMLMSQALPSGDAITGDTYKLVPLIHIDSVGGVFSENAITDSPEYVERFVPFNGAQEGDLAIYQSGDSMLPMIPSGAVLQIREVKRWREYFGFGDVFVLVLTDGRRITKKVTKCEGDDDFVLCVSFNEAYPPERLPRDMIVSVWKVIKVLNNIGW